MLLFFCATIWYASNISLATMTSDSNTGYVVIIISKNKFNRKQQKSFHHGHKNWKFLLTLCFST